jgi:ribosomal protein S18 acetylase RimI-like enzyme
VGLLPRVASGSAVECSDSDLRSGDDGDLGQPVTRTRSEYRMSPIGLASTPQPLRTIHPDDQQRDALAVLMLDAYRDTIDDEGETLDDACNAIDHSLTFIVRSHSYVMVDGADLVAFAFVVVVNGVHYIDPVVVASAHKRLGLGDAVVRRCIGSLAGAGASEIGATITDGNVASERLFTGLGFRRYGSWT